MKVRTRAASLCQDRGVTTMEIIIAVAVVGLVFFSIYQFAIVSFASVQMSGRQDQAAYLAEEGMEAVRTLRNQSWSGAIAPLSTSTTYYPVLSGGTWTLTTTNPGPIDGLFNRTITLQQVLRDGSDNIASSGTLDPHTRKVVVTVSWGEKTGNKQVMLETYLTNFLDN